MNLKVLYLKHSEYPLVMLTKQDMIIERMELNFDQWSELKKHCIKVGLDFLVSPFSIKAVNYLEKLGVKHYKIASGEINNYLMLKRIAETKKPLLISSGMSDYGEIKKTLQFLDEVKASKNRLLFQCTTSYPTKPKQVGLNVISELKKNLIYPLGYLIILEQYILQLPV